MLIETLIFAIVSFALFIYIFYQLVKKNDTKYVPILAIEALGIAIKFIMVYNDPREMHILLELLVCLLSIVLPIAIIIFEKSNEHIHEIIYINLARFYYLIGNTKQAKNILIELVTKNPESYDGHKLLGMLYEKEGGQRKAVEEYAQLITIKEDDYESYYKVATLLTDLDKKDEAIQTLTDLLNKIPDYPEATIALCDLLIEQQNFKEAANFYNEALKYNPGSFELNYNIAIIYTMLNDFASAKLYYERCAELNTMVCSAKYNLAEIAIMYKELDEAEKYLLEIIDDEELSADAYLELAKIYIIKSDKEKAIQYANVAIQQEPKRIVNKINKDATFAIIMAKLSIPFNLDSEEEKECKLSKKEIMAKEHLEEMVEITKKIGFADIKIDKNKKIDESSKEEKNIEREN